MTTVNGTPVLAKDPNASPPTPRRMTEEEFVAWCDEDTKAEWVNGEVIVMTPANTKHVRVSNFLLVLLWTYARRKRLGEVMAGDETIRFDALKQRRVPDLLFVTAARSAIVTPSHIEGPPDLILEVVSPDSSARDWRDKYLAYEAAGVQEYWIVDPMAQRVQAYTLGEDKRYTLIPERDGKIRSAVLAGFVLKPDWLWQDPLPEPLDILKDLGVL